MWETWDLVSYSDHDLSLILRRKEAYAVFGYPWKSPASMPALPVDPRAEMINVPEDRLFDELAIRARFGALLQLCKLARSSLNGSIPTSMHQIHVESLKFALKRYESKMITSADFLGMLRSAALIKPIPDSFWSRIETIVSPAHTQKLKQSMDALSVFHPKDDSQWLDDIKPYMAKVLWFANSFESIKIVAKQLAILYQDHRDDFNEHGDKASSMLIRAEIEADQASQKPWQRSASPKLKRSVRTGPSSRPQRRSQDDDSEEKN